MVSLNILLLVAWSLLDLQTPFLGTRRHQRSRQFCETRFICWSALALFWRPMMPRASSGLSYQLPMLMNRELLSKYWPHRSSGERKQELFEQSFPRLVQRSWRRVSIATNTAIRPAAQSGRPICALRVDAQASAPKISKSRPPVRRRAIPRGERSND